MTAIARKAPRTLVLEWLSHALSFWAEAGVDPRHGGFYEALQPNGAPVLAADRRVRVQARQIYVFSRAYCLGFAPHGRQVAAEGFAWLLDRALSPDGQPGFVHLLTPEGDVKNPLRDTYDHAFILLALAWLARATSNDTLVMQTLEQTWDFVSNRLELADGSLIEGLPAHHVRRQNPHMHMFEACLALHETMGQPYALRRAGELLALMQNRFICPQTSALFEQFDADLKPLGSAADAVIEPGHMAEWVWLMRAYERMSGHKTGTLPSAFADFAEGTACPHTGLIPDGCDFNGRMVSSTFRYWPQTERVKAWVAESEAGRPDAPAKAAHALNRLLTSYRAGPHGAQWHDRMDTNGVPVADATPASGLYHFFDALTEYQRVLGAEA
jgi:mannose-6-phosphate isomerase